MVARKLSLKPRACGGHPPRRGAVGQQPGQAQQLLLGPETERGNLDQPQPTHHKPGQPRAYAPLAVQQQRRPRRTGPGPLLRGLSQPEHRRQQRLVRNHLVRLSGKTLPRRARHQRPAVPHRAKAPRRLDLVPVFPAQFLRTSHQPHRDLRRRDPFDPDLHLHLRRQRPGPRLRLPPRQRTARVQHVQLATPGPHRHALRGCLPQLHRHLDLQRPGRGVHLHQRRRSDPYVQHQRLLQRLQRLSLRLYRLARLQKRILHLEQRRLHRHPPGRARLNAHLHAGRPGPPHPGQLPGPRRAGLEHPPGTATPSPQDTVSTTPLTISISSISRR